jgi:DNA polymerase III, alpha subunit
MAIFLLPSNFSTRKKAGIKPILGIEAYFTEDVRIKKADNKYYHLIILVENEIGYRNLCKLIHYSYTEGFYFKPRIDYRVLEEHAEGLIVTSACLGGHIPTLLMANRDAEAHDRIDWFLRVFGKERFYLEVQPDDQQDQKILNSKLFAIAQERDLNVVAAGDCHYTTAEDREAHEIMLAIQTQSKITDPKRFSFGDCRVHMRTTQEMLEIFKDHPEAIWNTGKIADRCNFAFKTGALFFPKCQIPDERTEEQYFKDLCRQGLEELIANERIDAAERTRYEERLQLEIDLIVNMGFIGYFLVVSDFIQWAKKQKFPLAQVVDLQPGRLLRGLCKLPISTPLNTTYFLSVF